MIFISLTPSFVHIADKNLDLNCGLLSVRTFVDMPKLLTQCSKKIVAPVVAVVFVLYIAFVSY